MAFTGDPTAAYRAQQGMAPVTQSYDPKVVGWIVQAAKATGADPAALLATSIQESGARTGAVGDNDTSFGPFQMHRGGALGSHSPAWANSYDAVLNRAQEFRRLQVHGGPGAAAVQRPADRSLYAQGVGSHLQQAHAILAHFHIKATPAKVKKLAATITSSPDDADVGELVNNAIEAVHPNAELAHLPGSSAQVTGNVIQDILNANARIAGIEAPTLPQTSGGSTAAAASAPKRVPTPGLTATLQPSGRVFAGKPKIIGGPFQGTHAKAFNQRGGSDNWESEQAVDIAVPVGTPIRAPYSGVIGSQIGSLGSGGRFAGLRVHLAGAGNELYFAHLSRLAVKAGQQVKAGQIIGYSGSANGVAHLHLAAKNGNPGRYA